MIASHMNGFDNVPYCVFSDFFGELQLPVKEIARRQVVKLYEYAHINKNFLSKEGIEWNLNAVINPRNKFRIELISLHEDILNKYLRDVGIITIALH